MNIFKEGEFIMKKFILTLFVLSSIGIFANDEKAEYDNLVKEEEARFQKERELSERAAAQNVELEKLKASIEEKLEAAPEERKTKFFKDTFDGLVKDYSKYLSQINEKIAENSEIVSNFEKIQKIR